MAQRRRGFAAINVKQNEQEDHEKENERIEALEARLVKQYQDAIGHIRAGRNAAARDLLQQLLGEPLLQEQHDAGTAASAAAKAAVSQSKVLHGLRYNVLHNLAPLLGQTQETLEIWRQVIEHNPTNIKAWEESSIVLAHLGHLYPAVRAAERALSLKPDSVVLLERLVVLCAAQGDWTGAGQLLLELARLTGGCHQWLVGLSNVTAKTTGFTQEDIQQCLQQDFSTVEYLIEQAILTASRELEQQQCPLVKVLQVGSVQDLLQQLLQEMNSHHHVIRQATGRAASIRSTAVSRGGASSPGNQELICVNSSKDVATATGGSAGAVSPSGPDAGTAAADDGEGPGSASLAQLKVLYVQFGASAEADAAAGQHAEVTQQQPAAAADHDAVMSDVADQQHQLQQQGPQDPEPPGHILLPLEQPEDEAEQQQQQQHGMVQPGPGARLAAAGSAPMPPGAAAAGNKQHHVKPPAGAASARARGATKHGKAAGQQGHKPVITAMQLVQETVGRWLPHAVLPPAHEGSTATLADAVTGVTGIVAPQPQHQHQQKPCTGARHTHLPSTGTAAAAGTPAASGAGSSAADIASAWEQHQQQVLQELSQRPSCYPMQLTKQLLAQLLAAAEEQQVPSAVCSLLLQLAALVPLRLLTQQQHLVLAELHVDAAEAMRAERQLPQQNDTASQQPRTAAAAGPQRSTAAAGLRLHAKAPAVSGGGRKRQLSATSGAGVGQENAVPAAPRQRAALAGAGAIVSEAATANGTAALASVAHAAAGTGADVVDVSAAKRARISRSATRQHQQVPSQAAASGGQNVPGHMKGQKRLEHAQGDASRQQQQELLGERVKQHLEACQLDLQQFVAARAIQDVRQQSPPEHSNNLSKPCKQAMADAQAAGQSCPSACIDQPSPPSLLWDPAHNQDKQGLCALKSIWWQKVQDVCNQQQQAQRSSNDAVIGASESAAGQQQQQQEGVNSCGLSADWMQLIQQSTGVSWPYTAAPHASHNSNTGSSNNSSSDESLSWGPSIAGWPLSAAAHQQQHQQQNVLHVLGPATAVREDWGLTLRVPGLAAFGSSTLLSPATVGAQLAAASQTAEGGPCCNENNGLISSMHMHMAAEDLYRLFSGAASQQTSDVDEMQLDPETELQSAADAAAGPEALAPAAAVAAPDTADLRRWWVSARLFEAQHKLEAADTAGRCCLEWFTASAAAAAAAAQPGTSSDAVVYLPSCQYDACISRAAVKQKLDCMWLTMQIALADKQQQEQEQLYQQLMQLTAAPQQQQQHHQQQQQGRQIQQEPLEQQQQQGLRPPAEQQHLQLLQQQQEEALQLVQQIHDIAEAVLASLRQRCLDGLHAGDVSTQKLEGLRLIQRTNNRAAYAVTMATASAAQAQNARLPAQVNGQHPINALQQKQQLFRCTELWCILLQLQRVLQLNLPQDTNAASSTAVGPPVQGQSLVRMHPVGRGHSHASSDTAAQLISCLRDLNRFWNMCTMPPSRAAESAVASAGSKHVAHAHGHKRRQQQQQVGDAAKPQASRQHEHTAAGTAAAATVTDAEATAARSQQQDKAQPAASASAAASDALAAAAAALAATEAAEQVQHSEQMLLHELRQQPELLTLLGHVQHQLLEFIASKCPKEVAVPVVAAAAAASGYPVEPGPAAAQPAVAIQQAAVATEAAPAAAGTRQKRHRKPTAVAVEAAAAAASTAVTAVPTAAHTSTSGRGSHLHAKLDLRSNKERMLLQEAAIGVLAVHELDPRVSGSAESVLGLVEGMYGLLSLRLSSVDEGLVPVFCAMWNRLLLAFHVLKQQLPQQQQVAQQAPCQVGQQQQLLLRIDQALAQLLLDVYGFDVPWRSKTFGLEPLAVAVATAAARHATAMPALATAAPAPAVGVGHAGPAAAAAAHAAAAVTTLGQVAAAACQLGAATSHAPQEILPDPATLAAAAVKAVQQLPAAAHGRKQQHHHGCDEVQDSTFVLTLFAPKPEQRHDLTGLLSVWRYVSQWAQPEAIMSNPRIVLMQQQHSAAPVTVQQQLLSIATASVQAVLSSTELQQQQQQQTVLANGNTQDSLAAAANGVGRSRQLNGHSSDSSSDTDSEDIDDDDHIEWPASALGTEELFWEQLKPIVQKVQEQVPSPPAALLAAAARRLLAVLDSPQLQLGVQQVAGGEISHLDYSAVEQFLKASAQQQQRQLVAVTADRSPVSGGDAGVADAAALGGGGERQDSDTALTPGAASKELSSDEDTVMAESAGAQHAPMAEATADTSGRMSSAAPTVAPTTSEAPTPAANSFNSVYGWTEADLQLVADFCSNSQQQRNLLPLSGPSKADLAAVDPLLEVHEVLYHAAGFSMPKIEAGSASLIAGGMGEVAAYERMLLADVAVRPDSVRPWQRLSQLYYSILQEPHSGLLEKAAGDAPPKKWRAAAAAGTARTGDAQQPAASPISSSSKTSRWQQLQVLQRYSRRALRSTVVMAFLLQQQQYNQQQCEIRDEDDEHVIADCVDQLGVLLRDAAMCLGPWCEPWQLKPGNSAFRQQLLRAAQACFKTAQQQLQSQAWEFPFVLGQTAAKIKAAGWQQQALQQYALACHQSRLADKRQSAVLLPYVKLHGTRLKLLADALSSNNVTTNSGMAAAERPTVLAPLAELLQLLQLLSRWCFVDCVRSQVQALLADLHGSLLLNLPRQQQQHLITQLQQQSNTQQQQQQQDKQQEALLQPWCKVLQLLLDDCCSALQYCQDCYSRALGPARYALARGLYKLGRYDEALGALEPLFKLSGNFNFRNNAMPFSQTLLTEEADIKPSHQPHGRKQQQQQDVQEDSTAAEPSTAGHATVARKRRRISNTVATSARQSASAATGHQQQQQGQMQGGDAAEWVVAESSWGSRPDFVRGWGVEENARQFNMRNRRSLLLYLKVITAKRDMKLLEQAREGLLGSVGKINGIISEGFKPKDLGDLAVGLQLHLLTQELGPALQRYQQQWHNQQRQQQQQQVLDRPDLDQLAAVQEWGQPICIVSSSNGQPAAAEASGGLRSRTPHGIAAAAGTSNMFPKNTGHPFSVRDQKPGHISSDIQLFLDILADSNSSLSAVAADVASAAARSLSDRVLGLLEGAFQLYFTRLQLLSPEDERPLQLGQLLAAAEQLMQDSKPAAATATGAEAAAPSAAAAVIEAGFSSSTFHDNKAAETLLQFLAHAYLAALVYELQQQQQRESGMAVQGPGGSGSSSGAAVERLVSVAKGLKKKWAKPPRNLSLQHQQYVALVQHLLKTTGQLLMQCQQLLVAAAEAAVHWRLAAAALPGLQALQLQQQDQQPEHVTPPRGASAGAVGVARDGSPMISNAQQQQQQQSEPMQVDGSETPGPVVDADAEQQPQQGRSRAVTPAPPDTPGEAEGTAATPGEAAAEAGEATTLCLTPGLTPGGMAEGRRSRRPRTAAAGHDQTAAAAAAAPSGAHSNKVQIAFDNPHRIAAVQAVLRAMKAVQEVSRVSCSSWLDRQYMQNGYRLVWKLVELGARSAGLTTAAVADGQTSQPTSDNRANKALQCAQTCLADLLKGQASKQLVEDSSTAADGSTDRHQQQQQVLPGSSAAAEAVQQVCAAAPEATRPPAAHIASPAAAVHAARLGGTCEQQCADSAAYILAIQAQDASPTHVAAPTAVPGSTAGTKEGHAHGEQPGIAAAAAATAAYPASTVVAAAAPVQKVPRKHYQLIPSPNPMFTSVQLASKRHSGSGSSRRSSDSGTLMEQQRHSSSPPMPTSAAGLKGAEQVPTAAAKVGAAAALTTVAPAPPRGTTSPSAAAMAEAAAALAAAAPSPPSAAVGGSSRARRMLDQTFSGKGVTAGGQLHGGSSGGWGSHRAAADVGRSTSTAAPKPPAVAVEAPAEAAAVVQQHGILRSAAASAAVDGDGQHIRRISYDGTTRRSYTGVSAAQAEAAARLHRNIFPHHQQRVVSAVPEPTVTQQQFEDGRSRQQLMNPVAPSQQNLKPAHQQQHKPHQQQQQQQQDVSVGDGQAAGSPSSNAASSPKNRMVIDLSMRNGSSPRLEGNVGAGAAAFLLGGPTDPWAAGQGQAPKDVLLQYGIDKEVELARRRSSGDFVLASQATG